MALSGFLSFVVSCLNWDFFLFVISWLILGYCVISFVNDFIPIWDFITHSRCHGPVRISCSFSIKWHIIKDFIYAFMVCLISSLI